MSSRPNPNSERDTTSTLMTSGEVADLFEVSYETVKNWVKAGKMKAWNTPGGHHRFARTEIMAIYNEMTGATQSNGHRANACPTCGRPYKNGGTDA